MGKLVEIICVGHNPSLPQRFKDPEKYQGIPLLKQKYEEMHQRLLEAKPEVLIVIGHDHINQWFMNNMPAFMVGKAPVAKGPMPWEEKRSGIPHYEVPIDSKVAKAIAEGGLKRHVDFAYSDEFTIDHGFTVPLTYVRPEQDLPIVPIFINVMAPPIPPVRRFYQVGEILRDIIEQDLPANLKVAVLVSGHLSVELGGPRLMNGPVDKEFDLRALDLFKRGDVPGLMSFMNPETLNSAGNFTAGTLDFVMAVGIAKGMAPMQSEGIFSSINTHAFLTWDFYKEDSHEQVRSGQGVLADQPGR